MLEKQVLKKLLANAFDIPIMVTYWDETSESYGSDLPKVHIKLNKKINIKDLSKTPTLVLAEAYMHKDIEIQGSIQQLIASAYKKQNSFLTNQDGFKNILSKIGHTHGEQESKQDIHSHYDIGNDFYKKWLDETMTYSCAYWQQDDINLKDAQIAKIHHVLDKLDTKPNKTLLDIGCGWGTLMIVGAKEYGLKTTGVTLSKEQYKFVVNKIKELKLEDLVTVKLMDYRELGDVEFDYVTSIGMFEHVGKENLELYFKKVSDYLKPNGRALIHGITGQHKGAGIDPFIAKYIFPGGYIPNVVENMQHIMDAKLQIEDLEPLRRHYQRTLEEWHKNYINVYEETKKEYGEPFARMWDLYLQACAASFESGNIDIMQYLITKGPSGHDLPMTRDYMYNRNSN